MQRYFTIIIILIAGLSAAGAFLIFSRQRQATDETVSARSESASHTDNHLLEINNAKIVPEEEIVLSFTLPGNIEKIFPSEGATLRAGEALLKLDTRRLEIERAQAEAAVTQAKNVLSKVKTGTRPEELALVSRQTLAAKTSRENANRSAVEAIKSAFEASDDAIRNAADHLFVDGETDTPTLRFTPHDTSSSAASLISDRKDITDLLDEWRDDITKKKTLSSDDTESFLLKQKKRVRKVRDFLDDLSAAVNALSTSDGIDATTLDTWKNGLAGARLRVATASATLLQTESAFRDAEKNTDISQDTLALSQAGPQTQDIIIAQAALDTALQSLALADDALEKATLRCPTDDLTITKIFPHQAEAVPAYQPVALLSTKKFLVKTDVPEEHLGKITVGQTVKFRFDAFPENILTGQVTRIKAKEVIRDENIYFQVESTLHGPLDAAFRSGMTGKLLIEYDQS